MCRKVDRSKLSDIMKSDEDPHDNNCYQGVLKGPPIGRMRDGRRYRGWNFRFGERRRRSCDIATTAVVMTLAVSTRNESGSMADIDRC